LKELSELSKLLQRRITDEFTRFPSLEPVGNYSQALGSAHPRWARGAYFFGGRQLPENYTVYCSFSCQVCGLVVRMTKRPVPCGQSRRLFVLSCGCFSYNIVPPTSGYKFKPITADDWESFSRQLAEIGNYP
jgi:hypothetical protein